MRKNRLIAYGDTVLIMEMYLGAPQFSNALAGLPMTLLVSYLAVSFSHTLVGDTGKDGFWQRPSRL